MQRVFCGLVNGSLGDPGLYVELAGGATLLDCGDLRPLSAARVHRIRELLISHAHVDHVFGFDWLLRLFLGEDRTIHIFGPAETARRILAKLEGYTWNIPLEFTFAAEVIELDPASRRASVSRLKLTHGIEASLRAEDRAIAPDGCFFESRTHRLSAGACDHGTPCLAYSYEQKRGVRVRDADLARLGLARGPWIKGVKSAILSGAPPDTPIEADGRAFRLGALAAEIAEVVPGAKLAYVTDTTLDPPARERLLALARGASVLYCGAKYMDADREKAARARHLTALDAAELARDAGVRELVLFHPSPRYEGRYDALLAEARAVFPAARFQEEPVTLTGL